MEGREEAIHSRRILIVTLITFLAAQAGLAQWRVEEPERRELAPPRERQVTVIRREVGPDDRLAALRGELEGLHARIGEVDRRLDELDREAESDPGPRELEELVNHQRDIEGQIEELHRRREEVAERIEQTEMELRERNEQRDRERRELVGQLGEMNRHTNEIQNQIVRIEQERRERRERLRGRLMDVENETARLAERLVDLQAEARELERELEAVGGIDADRARELRESLARIRQEIRQVRQRLRGQGPRPEGPRLMPVIERPVLAPARRRRMPAVEPATRADVERLRDDVSAVNNQTRRTTQTVEQLRDDVNVLNEQTQRNAQMLAHILDNPSTVGSAGHHVMHR